MSVSAEQPCVDSAARGRGAEREREQGVTDLYLLHMELRRSSGR